MWLREGTVLTVTSRALVAACDRLGIDTETLLRTVGIERQRLEDPDARLQNREAAALWAKAYELSGIRCCRCTSRRPVRSGRTRSSTTWRRARARWARPFAVRRATASSSTPPCTRGAHPGVLGVLIEHADLLLSRLPRGPELVERTRRAIGARLRGGDPSIKSVAGELGMSERSLQRRLRELGFTFNALADEVREATARLYLDQPDMALEEIGYLLGFADQSAFHRAFKRWTGCTPKQARDPRMRANTAGSRA